MKLFIIFGLLTVFSGAFAYFQNDSNSAGNLENKTNKSAESVAAVNKQPVLVELYTSQGCFSCPPADKLLSFLNKEQPFAQAELITLELHVDYWDSHGWKDEFSSAIFSRRQDLYARSLRINSTYTPQMVVDGRAEFIGSNLSKAQKAILDATKTPKAKIEFARQKDSLKITISDMPEHQNVTVFLAIAEDNLASNVRGGENSGKKLEHTSVVRELKSLGILTPEQKTLEIETIVQTLPNWKTENLRLVVFLQENASRKILGVNRINLM
jgi:hypothetical protein